jgi:hypothetical protein
MTEGVNLIKICCKIHVNVTVNLPVQLLYANKKEYITLVVEILIFFSLVAMFSGKSRNFFEAEFCIHL